MNERYYKLKEKIALIPETGIGTPDGRKMIFSVRQSDGFYIWNLENGQVNYEGCLKSASDISHGHSEMLFENNKIYVLPCAAGYLNIYDYVSHDTKQVRVSTKSIEEMEVDEYFSGVSFENKLIIFGYHSKNIFIYNMKEEKAVCDGSVENIQAQMDRFFDSDFYIRAAKRYQEDIFFVSLFKNSFFRMNIKTYEIMEYKITECTNGFSDIHIVDDSVWLIPYEGEIFIRYSLKENKTYDYEVTGIKKKWTYLKGVVKGTQMYVPTCLGSNPVIIDLQKCKIKKWRALSQYIGADNQSICSEMVDVGGELIVFQHLQRRVLRYSLADDNIECKSLDTNQVAPVDLGKKSLNESLMSSLENYLNSLGENYG